MRKRVDWKWGKFETFYHVAHIGSFTRTADLFNVTQPVITRRIQDLEKELDLKLFIRGTGSRGIDLTAEGLKIFQMLHRISRDFSEIDKCILELNDKEE